MQKQNVFLCWENSYFHLSLLCIRWPDSINRFVLGLSFGAHFKDGDGGQFGKVRVKTWHSWKLRRQIIKSLFAIFLMSSNVALVI